MNFAVLASRSGKECRCALSHHLNSSLAQRIAMISGCDWDFASGSARVVFIVCDDSFSHGAPLDRNIASSYLRDRVRRCK